MDCNLTTRNELVIYLFLNFILGGKKLKKQQQQKNR